MKNIVIACGGTGGHLTPGIALAQALEEKGHKVWLFISQKSVDSRLAKKYGTLNFKPMPGAPLERSPLGLLRFIKGFLLSFLLARRFYKKVSADALIAFGGFSSFGPSVAAKTSGIPIFIHEANRAVGRAVRLLARIAHRVYLPIGISIDSLSPRKMRNIGYPLRNDFRRIPRERARMRLGIPMEDRLLVILGGSQGAVALNQWVKQNLDGLSNEGISVYCITGMKNDSSGVMQLEGAGGKRITSRFVSFTDEMNVVLSAADLVVSRAGAGAIAEIVRCRVPAILVPYPYAADNHQLLNASFIEGKGSGMVCIEKQMKDSMFEEVKEVMYNEEFRAIIRRNLFALDQGDVAVELASDICSSIDRRNKPKFEPNQELGIAG